MTISSASAGSPSDNPMQVLFDVQHRCSRHSPEVDFHTRRDRLDRLQQLLDRCAPALAEAVHADFGNRPPRLTEIADMFVLRRMLAHARRDLRRWARRQKVRTPFYLWPGQAVLVPQPLGVVGIIAPWNYPVQLALGPAVAALAAGNRIMLKPSELTPRTSAVLADSVARHFGAEEFCVVQGGADLSAAFAALPFDHLFFTGSTEVGRKVAQAAAANLTPTTLELGGKSPCILDATCDLPDAALKIMHGKLINAGQTCIAPDYLMVPAGMENAFAAEARRAVARLYPGTRGNPDYASIINASHAARLRGLMDEAVGEGARLVPLAATDVPAPRMDSGADFSRQLMPVLVLDVKPTMRLMQEEIFGPILPVLAYDSLESAIETINSRPRPLAMYWFGRERKSLQEVLERTVSGGVTINDTLLHIAHENLPFGGIGESGSGAYHGEEGFRRFTHYKPVFLQSRLAPGRLLYPPYGKTFDRMLRLLRMRS